MNETIEVVEKCVTVGCGKNAKYKGICPSCYGQALRLINLGKTSWDELEELGLVRLEYKPFTKSFLLAKAKKEVENFAQI